MTEWSKQFGLFVDDEGVWRCKGRIGHADPPYSVKYPILLHRDHHLTVLYALKSHQRVLHNGAKETLMELRSRFWIVKGRRLVKRILHSCAVCHRYEGRLYRPPAPPPLPTYRVQETPPFA